jgi:TctA family transporter
MYLGLAIAVVGAILWMISGYARALDGAPPTYLGIPANVVAATVFAIGAVLFFNSRRAAKAEAAKKRPNEDDRSN